MRDMVRVLPDRTIVRGFQIIGTERWVFAAWRPYDGHHTSGHFLTANGNEPFGRVGTEELPASLAKLPKMTAAREAAVGFWRTMTYASAYDCILRAFPYLRGRGDRDMGEVVVTEPELGILAPAPMF